ncbi:MAG: hypothetical protein NVS9B14_03120 [Candidatus Acidiferrum sp.]
MSAPHLRGTFVRIWPGRLVLFLLAAMLLGQSHARAQSGPQPPCGTQPVPPYPGADDPAVLKSWQRSEFGRDWKPPECTGWTALGFTSLVTTTARFRYTAEAAALLRRFGAVSELVGLRYWSVTHKRWQPLILDAHALTGLQSNQRREDFTLDEMRAGQTLYFEQLDNISGKATYRMYIADASADRIVIDVENISTIHYLLLPVFRPGELQSIYFLQRESDSVWRYYSIVRTGANASRIVAGNESSALNRAVAFYRHFLGIPVDREPPAAR